jgi:hypothetical protein
LLGNTIYGRRPFLFAPLGLWDASARGPGVSYLGGPCPASYGMETTRSPKFLGGPYSHLPCSQTPGGTSASGDLTLRCCPVHITTKTPAMRHVLRLNDTAFAITVYASRPWSPMVAQDSLPTTGQALSGWIGYQQGRYEGFQLFHILLSQALLGAICALARLWTIMRLLPGAISISR